jgi:hypothetical protein
VEAEAAWWAQEAGRPAGGVGRPHLASSPGVLAWVAFWCPLEPSRVVFVTDKYDFI